MDIKDLYAMACTLGCRLSFNEFVRQFDHFKDLTIDSPDLWIEPPPPDEEVGMAHFHAKNHSR